MTCGLHHLVSGLGPVEFVVAVGHWPTIADQTFQDRLQCETMDLSGPRASLEMAVWKIAVSERASLTACLRARVALPGATVAALRV